MFNFSSGLLAGQHDNQKERAPPSRPTPVTFPSLVPPEPSLLSPPPSWTEAPSGISAPFLNLRKPSDVTVDTLALLNVSFQPQCDFETLLSSVSNTAESHLPPKSWLDPPEQKEPSPSVPGVQLLSSGRRVPDRNEFYVRAKELFFKNEDAFSNLTRKANGERVPLRLAHFRKFWEGLDNLAYYWDDSLDEYLPPKPAAEVEADNGAELTSKPHLGSPQNEEPRKKAKIEASGNETVTEPARTPASPISSSMAIPSRPVPPKLPWAMNMTPQSSIPVDLSKGAYKGYRIGNGAEMPDQYRLDCVRAFLDPIAWAFGVTLMPHRRPPVLIMEHVRFPVRMSTVAWRGPQDRMKARQGWVEGPVMGIQCRQDTNFGSTGDLQAESVLDAIRELGGMLLVAQERAREGKTEQKCGEGKWWTSKHRWGGGPGGEVGEANGASDETSTPKIEEKAAVRNRLGAKERRRPTPAENWKVIRAGNPLWDPKVVYEAIGKDQSVEWDDIFMVSSLNHHISVLKLRVHPLYIGYITDGTLPKDTPSDPNWCSPQLQRTRWFDLFDVEDRKEAMRGIWGLMSYLLRGREKADIAMQDA
ncbi:hypothetical protein P280DRAFT_427742 [Massarina eburnea CBS 473.64]|uniref:Uncharacterized protein n=1 Tax=Massarina eburnea CBS 473.64 TaxID=1395130 RepID=A0A6A6RZ35_9PLEO|nr:hypothetical protein P280DRAFT_427742 [Massarina eburnea CBS 473.64]